MSKKAKMIEDEEVRIHCVGSEKIRVVLKCILSDDFESVKWMQQVKPNGKLVGAGTLHLHSTRFNYSRGMLLKMQARNIHCIARNGVTSNGTVGLMGDVEKQEEDIR